MYQLSFPKLPIYAPKHTNLYFGKNNAELCNNMQLVTKRWLKESDLTMTLKGPNKKYEAPWNFSWIVPGFLAGSSCPHTIENLQFLKQEGISHLVTLSPEYKPPSTDFPGIQWSYIPIEEFAPPTLEDMKKFIELCEKEKNRNQAIATHCRAGRGRTGTMAACYFVHFHDMSPELAITKIRMMRPGSVETYAQERAVSQYRDYLRTNTKYKSV